MFIAIIFFEGWLLHILPCLRSEFQTSFEEMNKETEKIGYLIELPKAQSKSKVLPGEHSLNNKELWNS